MPESLDQILARKKRTKTLEQILAEGRGYSAPEGLNEPPPSSTPAEFDLMRNAGNEAEQNQMLLEGSLMGIGALAGGVGGEALGARLIPKVGMEAPRLIRLLATAGRIAPEIAGEAAGTYGGGRLAGMPHEEAKNAALTSAAFGLGGRTIARVGTRVTGRFAGLQPETTQSGIENPSLLEAPGRNAELEQAHRLAAQLESQRSEITPAHRAYQKMLGPRSSHRIDGNDILDIFQKNISGRDNHAAAHADAQVRTMADKFIDRLGPDSKISLGELDDYIRKEFTEPLVKQYANESDAVAAQRMMDVRKGLTDYLYERVGKGAKSAQQLAGHSIRVRETVENVFDLGKESKPTGTAAERIRTIQSPSGEAQKNRAVLKAYQEEYGVPVYDDAIRLSQQREWQGVDVSKALAIDSVLQPSRPGFVKGVALPIARTGARIARVVGPVTAAVTAGTQAEKKRKKVPQ